jgi:hypothetical protein
LYPLWWKAVLLLVLLLLLLLPGVVNIYSRLN